MNQFVTPLLTSIVALFVSNVATGGAATLAGETSGAVGQAPTAAPTWGQIRSVPMRGDLKAFWNVGGGDVEYNNREAVTHGFRLVNILNTYSDYPGRQKENIDNALKGNRTNPWKKPVLGGEVAMAIW